MRLTGIHKTQQRQTKNCSRREQVCMVCVCVSGHSWFKHPLHPDCWMKGICEIAQQHCYKGGRREGTVTIFCAPNKALDTIRRTDTHVHTRTHSHVNLLIYLHKYIPGKYKLPFRVSFRSTEGDTTASQTSLCYGLSHKPQHMPHAAKQILI